MTSIIAAILAGLRLFGALVSYLHDRQMLSAGQAEQVAKELEAQTDALRKANAAREAVRADIARDASRVRQHDEFERP